MSRGTTAGARWRFAELEWLRRVGRSKASRDAFEELRSRVEGSTIEDLKLRLAELQAKKLRTVERSKEAPLTAEVLLIQGELGWRRSRGETDTAKKIAYEQIILKSSLGYFISELGRDAVQEILVRAAIDSSATLPEAFDSSSIIDNWMHYVRAKEVRLSG